MSAFSNLDTALSEMKYGRGAVPVAVGSIGVCLDDSGQPVNLYIVDTIYGCGSIDVLPLDDPDCETPRILHMSDFWALM